MMVTGNSLLQGMEVPSCQPNLTLQEEVCCSSEARTEEAAETAKACLALGLLPVAALPCGQQ